MPPPSQSEMKHDIDKIAQGLDDLIGEAETILKTLASDTSRRVDDAHEKGLEKLKRLCGQLRNARSEIVEGARKIDGAVHSHPWEALAATAIVGFLAGLLVRRR